jgi:hypothetical protein
VQGHYVAFSPSRYTILVYDTEKPFSDSGSWTEKEVAGADNSDIWGYLGSHSDPNYVYFAPYQQYAGSAASVHGTVLRGRIDPCPSQEFPGPGEEDLTEYMLDDVGDYLSVSSGRVSAIGMEPDMIALLYQDYGKDCFDGFEILFDLRISSIAPRPRSTSFCMWLNRAAGRAACGSTAGTRPKRSRSLLMRSSSTINADAYGPCSQSMVSGEKLGKS